MRILRDVQPVAKVTLVFLLTLSIATIFTLLSPRAAHAEGFLLPTVRCVVQTLLADGCRTNETTPQAPTTQNTPSSNEQSSPPSAPQPAGPTSQQGQSTTGPYFEPIPEPQTDTIPDIQAAPSTPLSDASHIDESEYVAYFNTYSRYAVQRAQAAPQSAEIVQAGPEGWKIMGIAWYWWLIGTTAGIAAGWYLVVKHRRPIMK